MEIQLSSVYESKLIVSHFLPDVLKLLGLGLEGKAMSVHTHRQNMICGLLLRHTS